MKHLLLLTLGLCSVNSASAAFSWNITYDDVVNGSGIGFDDATFGAVRRSTFEAATDYVSSVLDGTGSVDLLVRESLNTGTGSLASGGTSFFLSSGFSNGLLFQHATTGVRCPFGIVNWHAKRLC